MEIITRDRTINIRGDRQFKTNISILLPRLVAMASPLTQVAEQIALLHGDREVTSLQNPESNSNYNLYRLISKGTVEQLFTTILDRQPTDDELIVLYDLDLDKQEIQEILINSEEFQSRMAPLTEHARVIFKRILQQSVLI